MLYNRLIGIGFALHMRIQVMPQLFCHCQNAMADSKDTSFVAHNFMLKVIYCYVLIDYAMEIVAMHFYSPSTLYRVPPPLMSET